MKNARWILAALATVALVLLAGSWLRTRFVSPAAIWTPAPATVPRATSDVILPVTPRPTEPPETPTPAVMSTTALPAVPEDLATPDPKRIIITEADVLQSVASGVGAQQGLTLDGLAVRFTGGKLRLTADSLVYGAININNLTLVGTLAAQDGRLQLQTETISPPGLITALIPSFANQALAQYTGQWYIEEVQTLEGRLEVRIR